MKCPVCREPDLVMADRQGIEIDYCPNCRGVWLDRGELDKIIERSATQLSGPTAGGQQQPRMPEREVRAEYPPQQQYQEKRHYDGDRDHYGHNKPYRKKREGFLSELFDFD